MMHDFRSRLSFNGAKPESTQRENWKESLAALISPQKTHSNGEIEAILDTLPSGLERHDLEKPYLKWVITENSHAHEICLAAYLVDGQNSYKVPSFHHLLHQTILSSFDEAWLTYFMKHASPVEPHFFLKSDTLTNALLWALARAGYLCLENDQKELRIASSLTLRAQLRDVEEWNLWALEANLITNNGTTLSPHSLDLLTTSGFIIYEHQVFILPKAAEWVVQLMSNGAWLMAKTQLAEALFELSHRIQEAHFLHHLSEIVCIQKTPTPLLYLKTKDFDKPNQINLYLAYRYDTIEVFSTWHGEEGGELPIGFESTEESSILYFRHMDAENEAESWIKDENTIRFHTQKHYWTLPLANLWPIIHQLLDKQWEVWAEKHKIETLSSFEIAAKSGLGWFELQAFEGIQKQVIDPLALIRYLKRKSLFIQLGNGQICVLPERWIDPLLQALNLGQADADQGWRFSSMYAPEVNDLFEEEPTFQKDELFNTLVKKIKSFDQITPLTQPEGFRAILRPYQLEGLTWLNLLCELHLGGILADDMGLGKTVQVLALLQHRLINTPDVPPQTILVVCPKAVQSHWLKQLSNLIPRLNSKALQKKDMIAQQRTHHQLFLTSYGVIRHHAETLAHQTFDFLILDEAQMIKNTMSQTTQAIKKLKAAQRFALTGTPIENRFEELVSIFSFLNPHAPLQLEDQNATPESIRELVQRALHPFVLRRLKEDVLTDLPKKTIEEILLPMEPHQAALYEKLVETYRHELTHHQKPLTLPTEKDRSFFLEGLLRLRQVATYPAQFIEKPLENCISNKLIYLKEQLPYLIEKGHRIVVFSQFLSFLKALSDQLNTADIRHSYIDGETQDREQKMNFFQSNQAIRILLISLRVGGVGIDLTHTDFCIIADPWWNEAVENQAIDRLHRFGQTKPVSVLRLLSKNSIEEKMEQLKENKSALAQALGKTNPDFLRDLKWEDFTAIF